MILAAPLVIPFAEAIGLSVATLGIAKASDMVNEYIQENPEQSMKIFQMIMPSQGIANALKNKSSEGDEEVSEDIDVEVEEKPKKLSGKEKGMRIKEAIRRARAGKGNYSSPDAEGSAVDIRGSVIREVEDMGLADKDLKDNYDPDKPKFDYKKFFKKRYADGGSIGIEVLFEEKKPRQGLFMGGSPLEGQALNIYNSMNAYGFDDQAIADALSAQGLYTAGGSTPVVEEGIISVAPNIINQGGGGDGPPKGPTFNRNDLLGTPDYFPAEPFSFKDTISDIGEYIKGGGIIGSGIRGIKNLFSKNTKDYVTTPQLKARDRLEAERKAKEEAARQEVERQAAYAQAEKDRITYAALEKSITSGQGDGGRDRPDSGPTATGAGMGVGGGHNTDYGFLKNGGRVGYKDGGLATLLNRRQ